MDLPENLPHNVAKLRNAKKKSIMNSSVYQGRVIYEAICPTAKAWPKLGQAMTAENQQKKSWQRKKSQSVAISQWNSIPQHH